MYVCIYICIYTHTFTYIHASPLLCRVGWFTYFPRLVPSASVHSIPSFPGPGLADFSFCND